MTTSQQVTMLDMIYPRNKTIKMINTKTGVRYYKGHTTAGRFFPLSKKALEKLDLSEYEVFQEISKECYVKINN